MGWIGLGWVKDDGSPHTIRVYWWWRLHRSSVIHIRILFLIHDLPSSSALNTQSGSELTTHIYTPDKRDVNNIAMLNCKASSFAIEASNLVTVTSNRSLLVVICCELVDLQTKTMCSRRIKNGYHEFDNNWSHGNLVLGVDHTTTIYHVTVVGHPVKFVSLSWDMRHTRRRKGALCLGLLLVQVFLPWSPVWRQLLCLQINLILNWFDLIFFKDSYRPTTKTFSGLNYGIEGFMIGFLLLQNWKSSVDVVNRL